MILLHESQRYWHAVLCPGHLIRVPRHRTLVANPFGARERGLAAGRRSALQRHCHSARVHYDFFLRHTHHDGRLRELISPAPRPRSRYSLPAHEQYKLLTPATSAHPPANLWASREGGRYRVDRLPASVNPRTPGEGSGLGDFRPASSRGEKYPGEGQLYHYHLQHAG